MPIRKFSEFTKSMQGNSAFLSRAPDGESDLCSEASVSYIEMQPGDEVKPHTHDRVEMYVFLTGRAKAMAGDDVAEVTTGDVLIAPIGAPHALKVIGSEPFRYFAFNAPPASTRPMVPAPEEALWRWNRQR
jgi:mannose-6-phosphate isomerase-like protein (cupin superfamily)